MFDRVEIGEGIVLPYFPSNISPGRLDWQTKDLGHPRMDNYKIENGRLFKEKVKMREKTQEEKQEEAQEHGFETWDDYIQFCEDATQEEKKERGIPPIHMPASKVVEETEWIDEEYHGVVEVHATSRNLENFDIFWSYEFKFTDGELEDITFRGERRGPGPNEVINKLEQNKNYNLEEVETGY